MIKLTIFQRFREYPRAEPYGRQNTHTAATPRCLPLSEHLLRDIGQQPDPVQRPSHRTYPLI